MSISSQELLNHWKTKLKDEKMYLKLLKREQLIHKSSANCTHLNCHVCIRNTGRINTQQQNVNNIQEFINQFC